MSSWAETIEDQVVLTLCDVRTREEDKSLSPPFAVHEGQYSPQGL